MGNVSHRLPVIHPVLDVGAVCGGHTLEMAAASITPAADRCVLDGAKAMAMTCIDFWTDAALREQVRDDFERGTRPSAQRPDRDA